MEKKSYRVARVNSFGVIESRTSPMPKRDAQRMAEDNNLLAAARADDARYVAVPEATPTGSALETKMEKLKILAMRLRRDAGLDQKRSAVADSSSSHAYYRARVDVQTELADELEELVAFAAGTPRAADDDYEGYCDGVAASRAEDGE